MIGHRAVSNGTSAIEATSDRSGRAVSQTLFALLVLMVGVVVAVVLIKLRKPPERIEQVVLPPLVEVRKLNAEAVQMVIQGYGTVTAKVEVDLIPEVAGKVVFVHSELKAGGVIPAGEKILQIDPSDYELAVRQAEAAVAEAQVRLDTETAEADVARREWRQLHPETEPDSPLVLREPQIRRARAGIASAKAQLATAELRLNRTTLSLPFDVLIVNERVDLGQYVGLGQSLAKVYGIDAFEIEVPLEDDDLAWFDVFDAFLSQGSSATERPRTPADVTTTFAGSEHTWRGYVVRTTGQVDRTSRMVPVVVEVPKPLELSDGKPPLLPGAFVKVSIAGKTLGRAFSVPRDAIHDGNKVWLVSDDRLHIREIDIVRVDGDFAYITSGVRDGASLVVSALDTVVEGMKVRTRGNERQETDQADLKTDVADITGKAE